jgi:predicted secreted Zn-dependent protease
MISIRALRVGAIAFGLTAALSSADAFAQVNKCGQGKEAIYTDKPCADGGLAMTMPDSPGGSVSFDIRTHHYAVSAPNFPSAVKTIQSNREGGHWGWAKWKVGYTGDRAQTSRGCYFKSVQVRVTGEIEMPEWRDEANASTADQERWRKSYAGLKVHEDGHIQNGKEFALLLQERLLGLGVVPCADLDNAAAREHQILYSNLRARDAEYDRRTDHGKRQDDHE